LATFLQLLQVALYGNLLKIKQMNQKWTIFILFQACFGWTQTPSLVIPKGHTSGITSVCFSNDGKRILTGSRDFTAKIWDLNAHELHTFMLDNEVQAIAFSPGGDSVLTGSTDGKIKLWKISGELLKTMSGHTNYITSVAFSPDGKTFLSASKDATARIWNATGKAIQIFKHSKSVNSAVFAKNGKSVLTGSDDKTAILWNLNGTKKATYSKHQSAVTQVRISDDGKFVLTASQDYSAILWSSNGNLITQVNQKDKIQACDFMPAKNNFFITGCFDGSVNIWDDSGKSIKSFSTKEWSLSALNVNFENKSIVTVSEVGGMQRWDLNGKLIKDFRGRAQVVKAVSFSPDGNSIVSACMDSTAKLWDILNNKYLNLKGHTANITSVAFSPGGDSILTGSEDKSAKLWNRSGKEIFSYSLPGVVNSVAFSRDGKLVFAGCYNGCTKLWDASGKEVKVFKQNEKITCAAFSPTSDIIATGSDERIVKLFDFTGKLLKTIDVGSQVNSIAFNNNGNSLVTGNFNGLTQIWDVSTGQPIETLGRPGDEIISVAASKDGKYISSGSNNGNIILWNNSTSESLNLSGHSTKVTSVNFSPDNKWLISSSIDGTMKIWDCVNAKELMTLVCLGAADWAVKNPAGLFDASPGAMGLMYYQVGLEIVELDQLKERYFEPGILGTKLGILKIDARNIDNFNSVDLYPEIKASIYKQELTVNLRERSGGMGKLSLFINDKEIIEDANIERKASVKINLDDYNKYFLGDTNIISLRAYNKSGWLKSQSYDLVYSVLSSKGTENPNSNEPVIFKGKPHLYAIIVGTSDYKGDKLDLRFPDKDAAAMANGIKAAGSKLFEERLHINLLTSTAKTPDAISSKSNIENAFADFAAKASSGDIILVYFSGHGSTYGDAESSQFYYLTKDFVSEDLTDPEIRKNFAVSSGDLTKWMTAIPARKQVMIFDACHSGKVVDALEGIGARDLSPSQIRALDRMKDRTGMFILTGSAADRVSFEASQFGQGLLTFSLLQGMSGLALTEDKRVDVATLFNYSRDEVPKLAKGINKIQIPVVAFPKGGGSFDIGIVDATVKIPLAQPKPVFIRNTFQNQESFADELGITESLSEYFRSITAKGAEAEMIYVDVNEYQNAYSLKGLYSVNGTVVTLRGKLYKDKVSLGEYQVNGDKNAIPDLINAIFEKVNPLLK
jgi:WD40 repeat protein